ncbi:MAG: hypothetical protein VYB15_02135 [Planctomycetota bacterium]|nr:hypothetical protein [Planctomycetota bacterium]
MTNLDGPSKSQHPRPEHIPDVEYEDEPPGSYLGEFRIGWWKFAWSALNVLVAALVLAGAEEPGASAPISTIWALLPASCILSFCGTLWRSIFSRLEGGQLPVAVCLFLDAASLVLRLCI